MNGLRAAAMILVIAFVISSARPAAAELHWPSWLGGKTEKISNAHSKTKKPVKPSTVAGKGKSKNLFTNGKALFSPKPMAKVVSKWPSERTAASRSKAKAEEKKPSWLGSMFSSKEPEPPRSIEQWMDLEQIKP